MIRLFEIIGDLTCQCLVLLVGCVFWLLEFVLDNIGGFIAIAIIGGLISLFGWAIHNDHARKQIAGEEEYALLTAYPTTCATHTMKIRIAHWKKDDPNFVVRRRHVDDTLKDCKEMEEARAEQNRQKIFME